VANTSSKIEFTGLHFKVYGNKLELYSADFQRIASAVTTLQDEHSDGIYHKIYQKTITDIQGFYQVIWMWRLLQTKTAYDNNR